MGNFSRDRDPDILLALLKSCQDVDGDVVEAGVFRARKYLQFLTISEKFNKACHAIDSFRGSAGPSSEFDVGYPRGRFNTGGAGWLRKLVANRKLALIHEGFVPEILSKTNISKVAFIHIDLDHYTPTKQTIEWVWPLISTSGVMVCHDYFPSRNYNCSRAIGEFILEQGKPDGTEKKWAWWIKG